MTYHVVFAISPFARMEFWPTAPDPDSAVEAARRQGGRRCQGLTLLRCEVVRT